MGAREDQEYADRRMAQFNDSDRIAKIRARQPIGPLYNPALEAARRPDPITPTPEETLKAMNGIGDVAREQLGLSSRNAALRHIIKNPDAFADAFHAYQRSQQTGRKP